MQWKSMDFKTMLFWNLTGFSVETKKAFLKIFLPLCSAVERNPNWLNARVFLFWVYYAIKPGVYLVFPLAVMFHAQSIVVVFKVFSIDHDLSWPWPCVQLLILHLSCRGQHKLVLFLYSSHTIMATFWLPYISIIVVSTFAFCCLHWSYLFFFFD